MYINEKSHYADAHGHLLLLSLLSLSGAFFLHYPRHRTLISINKRNTGIHDVEHNMCLLSGCVPSGGLFSSLVVSWVKFCLLEVCNMVMIGPIRPMCLS